MRSINVSDLKRRIDKKDIVLLDVREHHELKIASIEGCVHIPMVEIPNRFLELNLNKDIAVMCHSGVRSLQVCFFLKSKNFSVLNVDGGINMWSVKIDKKIRRY